MSFVLPGNVRSLRFSGEAKVAAEPEVTSPSALGKPRVRKPPPPSPAARPVPSAHLKPSAQRIAAPPPYSTHEPVVRQKVHDPNDGDPTQAMDRECRDVLPGGLHNRRRQEPTVRRKAAPLPSVLTPRFEEDGGDPPTVARYARGAAPKVAAAGAPYFIWILASILAGIISYHVAPEILTRFESPPPAAPSP